MANEQISVPLYAASEVLTAANMNISAGTGVPVFATTVTRDAAFGGANEKVLAEGQLCYLSATNVVQYYDGAAWATVGPAAAASVAIFNETQSSGTNGGTATAGSYVKRTLNTTIQNGITGCSIASSVITLPAGTYFVEGFGTVFNLVDNYKNRLQNTSDATTTVLSINGFNQATVMGTAQVIGYFTIAASKNFELQTRVGSTVATNGYGPCVTFGDEIYSTIMITKVA